MKNKKKKTPEEIKKNNESLGNIPKIMLKAVGKSILAVFNVIMTVGLIGVIAAAIVACAFLLYITNNVDMSVDDIMVITQNNELATKLYYYDDEGNLVENTDEDISTGTGASWVEYEDIPTYLRDAFIAIEDHRFWDHNGVDWIGTTRAAITFFVPIGDDRGGSTLTQQLVKNLTGDDDYSIQRKIQEIFRALNLEKELGGDKTVIIEQYCNIVYFAQGAYGVQEAAETYFGKDAKDLTLVECAALASIVQNPSRWDPKVYPENNQYRRRVILRQMLNQGLITRAEYDEAYNAELDLYSWKQNKVENEETTKNSRYTSWYTDVVISEGISLLAKRYGVASNVAQSMFFRGGYKIITAMDPEIQSIIEKHYQDPSAYFKNSEVLNYQSAFIVIDHETGQIKGLVGGRGEKTGSRIFNRATQARRSPGSSMKPIGAYALAVDKGLIDYSTVMEDTPYTISGRSGWPKNWNQRYGGCVTMEYAVAQSKNTVPVKLVASLGVNTVYKFLSETLGISTLVSSGSHSDRNLSSLALGGMTYGVTLREITTAYGIFPTGGIFTDSYTIISILDADGNVIVNNEPRQHVAIKESSAQTMVKFMESVVDYGTAETYTPKCNKMGLNVAGKTGTTDNDFDQWFVGYSPYYSAGVWIGYDQNQSLGSTKGCHVKIWDAIMSDIHKAKLTSQGVKLHDFDKNLLIQAYFCMDSGKLVTDVCNMDARGSRLSKGYFTKDNLPSEECDIHIKVSWCTACNKAANEFCPADQTTTKAMLNIDRSYIPDNFMFVIVDAPYIYKPNDLCVCHEAPVEIPDDGSGDGGDGGDGENSDDQSVQIPLE